MAKERIYRRERYLAKIRPFYDDDLIKVITGVRRCGKSSLMVSVAEELRERGVDERDIVFLDLDKRGNRSIKTPDQLEAAIEALLPEAPGGTVYLFIDEVQNVDGYEEVVNGFNTDGGFSIFITGSNSYLLSGELATKLTGRHLEFELFTLSFDEYLGMKRFLGKEVGPVASEFDDYLRYGGFPRAVRYDDADAKAAYIQGVVDQIIDKDVRRRKIVRNTAAFERVMDYVINNFAAPTSVPNIVSYLNGAGGVAVKATTVASYVQMLVDAKVLYRCKRFDLKSHKSLRGEEKYYLADPGIYFARNTDVRTNYGPALENAVYAHLASRGYSVSVGKVGKLEVDFIARKHDEYAYIQVSMTIADRAVEEREYRPFGKIRDNYPQFLLTMDPLQQKRDGVRHLNVVDVLEGRVELL